MSSIPKQHHLMCHIVTSIFPKYRRWAWEKQWMSFCETYRKELENLLLTNCFKSCFEWYVKILGESGHCVTTYFSKKMSCLPDQLMLSDNDMPSELLRHIRGLKWCVCIAFQEVIAVPTLSSGLPTDYHWTTTGKLYEFSYNFLVAVWWLSHQTISPMDICMKRAGTNYCTIYYN